MYVDLLQGEGGGAEERCETEWYKITKDFLPSVVLRKRHPGFGSA